jgi:hypothetical protein
MSHLEPEAKIFACSQSVYLAEKLLRNTEFHGENHFTLQ